jgi:hypothetical protein
VEQVGDDDRLGEGSDARVGFGHGAKGAKRGRNGGERHHRRDRHAGGVSAWAHRVLRRARLR